MGKIKFSYDRSPLFEKPDKKVAASINNRLGRSPITIADSSLREYVLDISLDGHTFCPATFKNRKRLKENFEQQQLFALDFDNKDAAHSISFDDVKKRADNYELPVLFAYETLSSENQNKFRVVFLNDVSVDDIRVAKGMQLAVGTIFPEADSSCYKDPSKMYYGGKSLLYYDDTIPTINIESIFRNLTEKIKDQYKPNHYKDKLAKFSKESGIKLTNGLLDVTVGYDNPTEHLGANQNNDDGKKSPSAIIYANNIIANGEIFPKYYRINFIDSTSDSYVGESLGKTDSVGKVYKNHDEYRSSMLDEMRDGCRLCHDFYVGKDMNHDELFGIATNMIQVETGLREFLRIQSTYPDIYGRERYEKWSKDIHYMKKLNYKPQYCQSFCPYRDSCKHGVNILSTVHPKRGTMEKLTGWEEKFYSIEEMQEDTYNAICRAYKADGSKFQVIKAMTGAGKSHSYLRLMSENPHDRFLIAVPTNLLKNEIYEKAEKGGIKVAKTPSLDEIKDDIPTKVWRHIEFLRKSGRNKDVQTYIHDILKKRNIPCLRKYVKEREQLKTFNGCVITTHRYLLTMDKQRLDEYDTIIVDEDIIFKSVVANQGIITISDLENLLGETDNIHLKKKIERLLGAAKKQSCIELEGFEYSPSLEFSIPFDISAFCTAEKFYVRKTSKEKNLKEDTVVFLKPFNFSANKYIIVSATADEEIYKNFFKEENVEFYECKKAKYQGTLKQYPEKSMSRTCVANNSGIIRNLMERFGMSEDKVITFLKENIGNLHFGNTEGSNTLEGEDILVIGTPYHAEFLYKLIAFNRGIDFDEDEEMSPQVVEHNGYRFTFTTFSNEKLRKIQFWMLESELEQAVGRSRLLRNECTVHLFSNFPLSQSQMVKDFDYEHQVKNAEPSD